MQSIIEQLKGIEQARLRFPRSVQLKERVSGAINRWLDSNETAEKDAIIALGQLVVKYKTHRSRAKSLSRALNALRDLRGLAAICSSRRPDPVTVMEIFVDSTHRTEVLPFLKTWARVSGEKACDMAADEMEAHLKSIEKAKVKAAMGLTRMPKDHPGLMSAARQVVASRNARRSRCVN